MSEWRDAGADVYCSSCKLVYCWMSDRVIRYTIIKTLYPCIAFERHTSCTVTKLKFSLKPCESIASPNSHSGLHFAYLKTDQFNPAKQPHIPNPDRLSQESYINTIPTRSAMEGRAPRTHPLPNEPHPQPYMHATAPRVCIPTHHARQPCTPRRTITITTTAMDHRADAARGQSRRRALQQSSARPALP
jgi:hypothetical protein